MRQPLIFGNSLVQKRKSSTLFVNKANQFFFKKGATKCVTTPATLDNDQVALS